MQNNQNTKSGKSSISRNKIKTKPSHGLYGVKQSYSISDSRKNESRPTPLSPLVGSNSRPTTGRNTAKSNYTNAFD